MKTKVKRGIKSRGIKSRGIKSRGIKSRKNVVRKKASSKVKLSRGKNRGSKKGGADNIVGNMRRALTQNAPITPPEKYLNFTYPEKLPSSPIEIEDCKSSFGYICGKGSYAKVYKVEYNGKTRVLRLLQRGLRAKELENEERGIENHKLLQRKIRKKKDSEPLSEEIKNNFYIVELYGHGTTTTTKDSDRIIELNDTDEQVGNFFSPNLPFSIIEFGQIDLFDYINRYSTSLEYGVIKEILRQISVAINFIHQNEYVYFDLKLENIIVTNKTKPIVRLIDFGMLKSLESARDFTKGTLEYMAKETFQIGKEDPYKCDVFSFGMLMYELFTLKYGLSSPIDRYKINRSKKNSLLNYNKLNTSTFDEFPPEYSVLKPLLQLCVKTDPAQRPTMKQIVKIFSLPEEELTKENITPILESPMMGHSVNSNSGLISVYN
jgi:serine/threonine protein kinase